MPRYQINDQDNGPHDEPASEQILQTAMESIADEGYSSLTMRHLARASGLIRAMVDYLSDEFRDLFVNSEGHPLGIRALAERMLSEAAQAQDGLWPQLWAMQQVEPLVSDLLEDVKASLFGVFGLKLWVNGFWVMDGHWLLYCLPAG